MPSDIKIQRFADRLEIEINGITVTWKLEQLDLAKNTLLRIKNSNGRYYARVVDSVTITRPRRPGTPFYIHVKRDGVDEGHYVSIWDISIPSHVERLVYESEI